MKKLLLSASALFLLNVSSFAQVCTPNISCIPGTQAYGVCPDSATGLAVGIVGVLILKKLVLKYLLMELILVFQQQQLFQLK
ncbi:MAG: hypothetical protein IPH89_09425 [Bacteroidetes bacterium]|nr:hypothetical protein [Bacteroidota bacterium]